MNTRPEVIVDDLVLLLGNNINGLNLVNTSDADGDTITRFRFMDTYENGGFFRVNGFRRDHNVWVTLDANELNTLEYESAPSISRETIRAQVFDGTHWSDVSEFFIYSALQNTHLPELKVFPFQVVAYEKINVIGWVRGSDPLDGHPITRWKFRNRKVGGGYFMLDGVKLKEGTGNGDSDWIYVQNEDLPRLQYVGALNGQREVIDVRVRDSSKWSFTETIFATTTGNIARPVVQETTHVLPRLATVTLDEFVPISDSDGNTYKSYQLLDTSQNAADNTGFVTVRGSKMQEKVWVTLTPEDMRNATYTTASIFRTDKLRVRAFDGKFWSKIGTISFQALNKPAINSNGTVPVNGFFDRQRLINFFTADPSGLFFQDYQVVDMTPNVPGPNFTSAELLLDPTPDNDNSISDGFIRTLSPGQLNDVIVRGGRNGRFRDEFFVRGFNGRFWSDWERIVVRTDSGWDSFGTSWFDVPPPPFTQDVFYSFAGSYRNGDRQTGPATANDFIPVGFDARQAFRRQFHRLNQLVEFVNFVEVPDGFVHPNGSQSGVIRIHGWIPPDLNATPPPPCSYTYAPTDHSDPTTLQEGGDIWVTYANGASTLCGGIDWSVDSANNSLAAREILTAVGKGQGVSGDEALALQWIFDNNIGLPGYGGTTARSYGLLDISALQQAYGADTDTNITNTTYDINNYWQGDTAFVDNIYDTGGHDTFDLSDLNGNTTLSLVQGDISQVGAIRIGLTYGSLLEDAVTGSGDDFIQGNQMVNVLRANAGDDTISSWGGNDFMYGGAGSDNYMWGLADGHDTIDEMTLAGRDRITIQRSENLRLNDLAEDVSFRRVGRDLEINFPVNGEYTQGSLTIKNQRWGGSRIETLNIFGLDLDLTRIYAQTLTVDTRFNIDFASPPTIFGLLTTPA